MSWGDYAWAAGSDAKIAQIRGEGNSLFSGGVLDRAAQLQRWLETTLGGEITLAPASDDASFRRYYRVRLGEAGPTLIAMDAPPDKESCAPFVKVAGLFSAAGAHVP